METLPIPDWDELFMRHAYLISSKSKDTRTKIGAVLVRDKRIISEGYNGLPVGVNDAILERYERPEKYYWFEHGERNAIYSCARAQIGTLGSTMYTQGIPCADCARGVVQSGICRVVVHAQWQKYEKEFYWERWLESAKRSELILKEGNVAIQVFDRALGIKSMLDGKVIEL